MKNTLITFLAFFVAVTVISSCKKDDPTPKTEEEINIELLSKVWVAQSGSNAVTVGGTEVSDRWSDFVLTLADKSYNSTDSDAADVWPASGTWAFGSDANTLVRNDGVEITISVTETTLVMKFNYNVTGGRLSAIEGDWVFNMVPQK